MINYKNWPIFWKVKKLKSIDSKTLNHGKF